MATTIFPPSIRADDCAAIVANAPHLYDTAQQEELQFFNAVADCLAQCAATFGGGIAAFGEMNLLTLLRWTHRAVLLTRPAEEGE